MELIWDSEKVVTFTTVFQDGGGGGGKGGDGGFGGCGREGSGEERKWAFGWRKNGDCRRPFLALRFGNFGTWAFSGQVKDSFFSAKIFFLGTTFDFADTSGIQFTVILLEKETHPRKARD